MEYFSHDYNARNDFKLKKLLFKIGVQGIGIYWCLVEMLYENGGSIEVDNIPIIAEDLRTNEELINSVINDFGLFEIVDGYIINQSVNKRMGIRAEKSEKARESAKKRWKNANAMPSQCDRIDDLCDRNAIKGKESKEKEIKENKIKVKERERKERETAEPSTPPHDKKTYGQFSNVFLTDDEHNGLIILYPQDYEKKIDRLSEYMHQKGKNYADHYSVINKWAKEDEEKVENKHSSFDVDEFFELACRRSKEKILND